MSSLGKLWTVCWVIASVMCLKQGWYVTAFLCFSASFYGEVLP